MFRVPEAALSNYEGFAVITVNSECMELGAFEHSTQSSEYQRGVIESSMFDGELDTFLNELRQRRLESLSGRRTSYSTIDFDCFTSNIPVSRKKNGKSTDVLGRLIAA